MKLNEIEHKIACNELSASQVFTQMKQHISITQPPIGPPGRMFKRTFFMGEQETEESKRWHRDYLMFSKGYQYANGAPNISQPGDYV